MGVGSIIWEVSNTTWIDHPAEMQTEGGRRVGGGGERLLQAELEEDVSDRKTPFFLRALVAWSLASGKPRLETQLCSVAWEH